MKKAVFIDRDGTINKDPFTAFFFSGISLDNRRYDKMHFVKSPNEFIFLPRSVAALKELSKTENKIIVVSNQRCIEEGYLSEEKFIKIEEKMLNEIKKAGARIDAIYYCPHKQECECKKPKTGMLERAVAEHDIDLGRSYVVGDTTVDIMLAKNAGCKSILVRTGYKGKDKRYDIKADFEADDLYDAVQIILEEDK